MSRVYQYKVVCICLVTFIIICFISINHLLALPSNAVCREVKFSQTVLPVTALASFPGSGNTWTRHLIQKTTGLLTGSIYNSSLLKRNGFPGEGVRNGSVVVVKTHMVSMHSDKGKTFDRAILILRDPYDAIVSYFNFKKTLGFVGHATQKAFDKDWVEYVNKMTEYWKNVNRFWLQIYTGPIHVVKYQNLKTDLKGEMQKICTFLDIEISEHDLNCVYYDSIGNFKRGKSSDDLMALYTPEMKDKINGYRDEIYAMLEERISK